MASARHTAQIVSLSLWLWLSLDGTAIAQTYFDFPDVTYHTCYDEDTCMVSLPGVHPFFGDHILVRLAGIDTLEIKGKCDREKVFARQARDFVRDILGQASKVELKKAERDKYFRINARVIADGEDVSGVLILKGFAVPYDGGTKTKDWCAEITVEPKPIPALPLRTAP